MEEERIKCLIKELIRVSNSGMSWKEVAEEMFLQKTPSHVLDLSLEEVEKRLFKSASDKSQLRTSINNLRDKGVDILDSYLRLLYHFVLDEEQEIPTERRIDEVKARINKVCQESTSRLADPKWSEERPNMSWDFVDEEDGYSEWTSSEGEFDQEHQLIEDLLSLFMGCNGVLIKANPIKKNNEVRTFRICCQVAPSYQGLVRRILPLASHFSTIARFIEEKDQLSAGRVNQALAASMKKEIQNYFRKVCELETLLRKGMLDLNLLWSELLDAMHQMNFLAQLSTSIEQEAARGGTTLSILHGYTVNCLSDPDTQNLCFHLTRVAAQPYFDSVSTWIFLGKVYDPYDEFMITEKPDGKEDNISEGSWCRKFSIRRKYIPKFLESLTLDILNTGKYIDVIRRSIGPIARIPRAPIENLVYDIIDYTYIDVIKRAYEFANIELLNLLVNEHDILERLRTAKSFFSIEYGDLFYNLVDNCLEELERPAPEVCISYLPSLVRTSIETSSAGVIPYSAEFGVYLEKGTLKWQINNLNNTLSDRKAAEVQSGLEAVTLKMKTRWPVCLILHVNSIKCYQMLFRHLFYLKYVYMKLTSLKSELSKHCHALKYSMIVFVQTCSSYMTIDTTERLWQEFETDCDRVMRVGELMEAHNKYLFRVLNSCMLTSAKMFDQLRQILETCLRFAEQPAMEHSDPFVESLYRLIESGANDPTWANLNLTLVHTFTHIPDIMSLGRKLYII